MGNGKEREIWVDNVKVVACILVVIGHFFQSMTKAGIVPANDVYLWFDKTIYLFHVPLFFVCSGYLYQKYSQVDSILAWLKNVKKKAILLGVPYLVFSTVTWGLKTFFPGSVNDQVDGLFRVLFVHPTAPYWYLYCLFFMFVVTPTFNNKKVMRYVLLIGVLLKVLSFIVTTNIYSLTVILVNEIWFVLGMCLFELDFRKFVKKKNSIWVGVGLLILFLVYSVVVYDTDYSHLNGVVKFVGGLLACIAIVLIIGYLFRENFQSRWIGFMAEYTLPIFLMHTIFAATLRSVFLKVGIANSIMHVVAGLTISFMGPIIAMEIMKHFKWLEFLVYPGKYVNKNRV